MKGGGPRNVMTLCNLLSSNGYKSNVLSFRSNMKLFKRKPDTDTVTDYGALFLFPGLLYALLDIAIIYKDDPNKLKIWPFTFKQKIIRPLILNTYERYDYYISTGWQTYSSAHMISEKNKSNLFYFVQADETTFSRNKTYKREVLKTYYNDTPKFTQSKYLVEHFKETYDQILDYIGLGVNHDVFKPIGYKKEKIVFTIFRDDPNKGFYVFVKAMNKLWNKRKDFTILIGGGTPERNRFNIEFPFVCTGWISNDDELAHLYEKTIFVNTGVNEALPMPPLEAMASGSTVITSRIPGAMEFIEEGKNCLAFIPEDENDLIDKIESALDDTQLRLNLSKQAKVATLRYNWNTTIEKFLHLVSK